MNSRLLSIIRKEFIHILRDPRTLAIMFVIPVVQLILLGYAATSDVRRLNTAVYDADKTMQSRQLIEAFRASDYFAISRYVSSEEELAALLDNGQARVGIVIPPATATILRAVPQCKPPLSSMVPIHRLPRQRFPRRSWWVRRKASKSSNNV
jgi:ABC-2 type transport system permease protein